MVSGGELQGTGDGDPTSIDSIIVTDAVFSPDVTVDVALRYISGESNSGDLGSNPAYYVLLRYVDADNYIYVVIDPVQGTFGNKPKLRIKEMVNGTAVEHAQVNISSAVPSGNPSSVVSHLQVSLTDLRVVVRWDNAVVFDQLGVSEPEQVHGH